MELNNVITRQPAITEQSLNIASFENVKRITNVKTIVISTIILAIGAYMVFFLNAGYPGSNLDIFRIFCGWTLIIASLCNIGFKSKQWIYQPTSSAISRNSVTFNYQDFHILKELLAKHADRKDLKISGLNSVHIEFLHSKDKKFMAYQVFQYSSFIDVPVTDMEILSGEKAKEFIDDLLK